MTVQWTHSFSSVDAEHYWCSKPSLYCSFRSIPSEREPCALPREAASILPGAAYWWNNQHCHHGKHTSQHPPPGGLLGRNVDGNSILLCWALSIPWMCCSALLCHSKRAHGDGDAIPHQEATNAYNKEVAGWKLFRNLYGNLTETCWDITEKEHSYFFPWTIVGSTWCCVWLPFPLQCQAGMDHKKVLKCIHVCYNPDTQYIMIIL